MGNNRWSLGFDHNNMEPSNVAASTPQTIWEAVDGKMVIYATAAPADAATGYSEGCLCIVANASGGATLYVNEGSDTVADFNLVITEDNVSAQLAAQITAANAATIMDAGIPVLFASNYGTAGGAGPSPLVWADCPLLDIMLDPTVGFQYFDDYLGQIDVTTADGYVITAVTSGGIAPVITEDGGVMLVDSQGNATADDGVNVQLTNCLVKPLAGRKIYFEARVKMNDTSANISQFYIGLAGVDATLIATGVVDDVVDKAGFYRQSNTTGDRLSIINSRTSEEEISADKATTVDDTYIKLGMVIDGITSVAYYVDGVLVDTHVTANAVPNAVMCLSYVAQTEGASKDAELSVDWVRIAQTGARTA